MDSSQIDGLEWRRSSHCNGGSCVEVARAGSLIKVRRTDDSDGMVLNIQAREWREFVAGAQAGRFDLE